MYLNKLNKLNIDISYVAKISKLSEWRGLYKDALSKKDAVRTRSFINTVIATSAIEGITVSTKSRADELIANSVPVTKQENEFVNGIKLNEFIYKEYENIQISVADICNLHNILMRGTNESQAGKLLGGRVVMSTNNETGEKKVVHHGSSSSLVKDHMQQLVDLYNHNKTKAPSFILACLFISEFLAIHPFIDGNGRVARALFNLILLQNDYFISNVQSIDHDINSNLEGYYNSLEKRSKDWNEAIYDINSNLEFIYYMIDILHSMYMTYDSKSELNKDILKVGKKEAVKKIINSYDSVKVSDILNDLNGVVSRELVSKVLSEQAKEGKLIKIGKGKGTKYKKA